MHDHRNDTPRGRVIHYGAAKVGERTVRRALVVEFEDTASLDFSVNSGFAEFDMDDDTVAVVLTSQPKPGA